MFLMHPPSKSRARGSVRIYLEFLVLFLHHLAQASSSLNSAQQGSPRQPNKSWPPIDKSRPLSCSNESQFTCSINNICIPIEWRCDFIEHCPDGQDEFGCPAESCDFGRDLCNWWNRGPAAMPLQPEVNHTDSHPERAPTTSPTTYSLHINRIWRRHSNKSHKKWNTSEGLRPTKEGLEIRERSNWLLDKLEPQQGFVFVALSLGARFLNMALDNSSTTSSLVAPPTTSADNNNNNNHLNKLAANYRGSSWRQEAKSSRLVAPYLGRTSSACQLRFKYVLWSNIMGRQHHHDYATNSSGATTSTATNTHRQPAPKFNITLSLRLIERQTKARAGEPLSFAGLPLGPVPGEGVGANGRSLEERIVWQKMVDTSSASLEDSQLATSDWLVGVAELGRIQQRELYFEASLVGRLSPSEALQLRLLGERRREQGEARLMHASMVALTGFNFRSCAWPQTFDSNRLEQASSSLDDEWELETGNGPADEQQQQQLELGDQKGQEEEEEEEEDVGLPEVEGDERLEQQQEGRECMQDEFKCSNGICVPGYRMCNFVDDCMAGWREGEGPEDEALPLCASVPGMQDFEMPGLKGAHLYGGSLCSGSGASGGSSGTSPLAPTNPNSTNQWPEEAPTFWSLTSNWPTEGISVQNSIRGEPHLPLHDHTLRSPRGHYLSFELPTSVGKGKPPPPPSSCLSTTGAPERSNQRLGLEGDPATRRKSTKGARTRDTERVDDDYDDSSNNNIFWIYLDSPWMRKKGALSLDTNSNYTNPPRLPSAPAECRVKFFYNIVVDSPWAGPNIPPFRLYLALEHFALVYDSLDHSVSNSRQLDMFTHSELHEIESSMLARSDGFIEYPGTDFWREINYKLRNLNESDLFYLRIAIVAEPIHSPWADNIRVTINLDDIATHFGCAQIYEDTRQQLNKYHRAGRAFNLSNYFRSQTHTSDRWTTNTRFRHKGSGLQLTPVQFEPQRLIMYVFLVLSGIIGLILLIVFVTVPYVERFTINYHDQLNADLTNTTDSTSGGSSMMLDRDMSHHICQLATVSSTVDESWQAAGSGSGSSISGGATKSAASSRLATRHSSIMTMSDC